MRKLGVLFAILSIAALSPAPIREAPPPGTKVLPKQSQAQLVEEQRHQQVQKEVGMVPQVTDRPEAQSQNSAPDAAKTLQQAEAASQKGEEVVRKASKELEHQSGGMPMIFWGILFIALGFGSVYAFRYWMAKNVPMPGDTKHRVTW